MVMTVGFLMGEATPGSLAGRSASVSAFQP
jgi:hypothetical protein